MKIIKKGNLRNIDRPIRFACNSCGCVFEAINTEYEHEYSQREMQGWYTVECPCCGRIVTKDDEE